MTQTNNTSDQQSSGFRRRRVHIRQRERANGRPNVPTLEAVTIEAPRSRRATATGTRPGGSEPARPATSNVVALRPSGAAPAYAHAAYGQMSDRTTSRVNLVA